MGRNDKHKQGRGFSGSRNNPVFKIVGGKAGKALNGCSKAKAVDVKLKKLKPAAAAKSSADAIAKLDAKLANLQKRNVSLSGSAKKQAAKISPVTLPKFHSDPTELNEIVDSLGQTSCDESNKKKT
jgi:uncharacterized protein YukE